MTRDWLYNVAQSGLGDLETFEATYDICRAVLARDVPGDFVECGVYAGAQCAVMAIALLDHFYGGEMGEDYVSSWHDRKNNFVVTAAIGRRVHLFDSFAGIPAPGKHDTELKANKGGESACSLEDVKANMKRWGIPDELLVYHPGLFKEVVPMSVAGIAYGIPTVANIAVLRLDGDLYESTAVCMRHLYPLVFRGGWVIVDDFNLHGCRLAVRETVTPAPIYFRIPTK